MLRLAILAMSQVPKAFLELGDALGATRRTILWKIERPAAEPTILVGAGGLGAEVTRGLTRIELGVGLRAGRCIVAVALHLDRPPRAALDRPPRRGV